MFSFDSSNTSGTFSLSFGYDYSGVGAIRRSDISFGSVPEEYANITLTSGVITSWDIVGGYCAGTNSPTCVGTHTSGDSVFSSNTHQESWVGSAAAGVWSGPLADNFSLIPQPLPAALPLFATGLGGVMGLLGWRRKRKNAAALAA